MTTYITLKQDTLKPIIWYKVLRVVKNLGVNTESMVQILSTDGNVSVVSMDDIDKITKD